MFMKSLSSLLSILLSTFLFLSSVYADDVTSRMKKVHEYFSDLQPYMIKQERFQDPENTDEIAELLTNLRSNFHTLDSVSPQLGREPGFKQNLQIVNELLRDASNRFNEGNKLYALWRIRTVSNYCISCHAQYHVQVTFEGDEQLKDLNDFEKGQFYLATRQPDKAQETFFNVVKNSEYESRRMPALRSWLVIQTRIGISPSDILTRLHEITEHVKLPGAEEAEVNRWKTSLTRWGKEKKRKVDPITHAESLITSAFRNKDVLTHSVDEVLILRATTMLHSSLANPKLSPIQRKRALFLLGYSYANLPLYFIDELPEIYLELCINEFPGTKDAQNAFRVYKEKVELDFTGSSGTEIPEDVSEKLKELHDRAYRIPSTTYTKG